MSDQPFTGPADTNDPNVRVSTVIGRQPTGDELRTGVRPGSVEVPARDDEQES